MIRQRSWNGFWGDHPDVEFVQIQMNYIDMESTAVDARRVYETCLRFHKPVIVMEPVKGGSLVKLPPKAQHLFDTLQQGAYPKGVKRKLCHSFRGRS